MQHTTRSQEEIDLRIALLQALLEQRQLRNATHAQLLACARRIAAIEQQLCTLTQTTQSH